MLREVFFRELLESIAGWRLLVICLLCCVLIPLSLATNLRAVANSNAQQSQAQTEYEGSLHGRVATDEIEVRVFRHRPAMAGLAAGLDPAIPTSVSIRQTGMNVGQSQLLDNPVATLFGGADLLFIIKFVLSLVAIILTYNLICGEKEMGTLKLMLSNPIPRDSILLGKLLSALVTLLGPFLFALLGSLLGLEVFGSAFLGAGIDWLQLAGVLLASVLYLGVFVNLGLVVSAMAQRSLTSITLLLVLWAGCVAVIPQSAGVLAELVYPVESADSLLLRKSLAAQDVERQQLRELESLGRSQDHFSYDEIRKPIVAKYREKLRRLHQRLETDYGRRRRTQERIASGIALFSPASALTFSVTTLCGTGMLHADDFNQELEMFRSEANEQLFAQNYRDLFLGASSAQAKFTLIDLSEVPRFSYTPPPVGRVFDVATPYLILLGLFNCGLFFIAYLRFRTYDVR
jgi:ABC-type transport system involved in multi-copper enzyme maturation permease subunit